MSATDPGDYTVTVIRPDGREWAWTGYADNDTDALALAEFAWQADEVAWTVDRGHA